MHVARALPKVARMVPVLRIPPLAGALLVASTLLGTGWILVGCRSAHQGVPLVSAGTGQTPCTLEGIENAFQLGPRLWSGGEPHGDRAFKALAAAGVRTVVSVDGAKPDLEAARRHGLRYVHIPIGYDGLSTDAVASLASLTTTDRGGVFVHCHHGKHRGPTAAALLARASGAWDATQAEAWQKRAGTSKDYSGLYQAVREFRMPDTARLQAAAARLQSSVPPSGLVESMVIIDGQAEAMADMKAAGWRSVPAQPDETPAQAARLLHEQFKEGIRLGLGPKDPEFRRAMESAERSASALMISLQSGDRPAAEVAWKHVKDSCTDCHKTWRNQR